MKSSVFFNLFLSVFFLTTHAVAILPDGNEYFTKALQYKEKGNMVEAWRNVAKAVEAEPNNDKYKELLADVQYTRKAYYESIPLYEQLIAKDENNITYLARLAEMYSMSSKKNKADEYASILEEMKPEDATTQMQLAKTYYELRNYPKAIKFYKKTIELMPDDKDIPYKIAKSYAEMDNFIEAEKYYDQTLKLDEKNSGKFFEAARNLNNAGKFDKALEYYKKADEAGFYKTNLYYQEIGDLYFDMGRYPDALLQYDEAKKFSPYDADLLYNIANTYFKMTEFSKCRDIIDNSILANNPNNADALYLKGLSYFKDGQTGRAERNFEKAFAIDPSLRSLRTQRLKF